MDDQGERRFWQNVVIGDECWGWLGRVDPEGYATVRSGRQNRKAHRVLYEHLFGAIGPGLELDHTCHNQDKSCSGHPCLHRLCTNPSHMEPVSKAENLRRSHLTNQGKDHCKNGHEFTPENTRVSSGQRRCIECCKTYNRRYRAKPANA